MFAGGRDQRHPLKLRQILQQIEIKQNQTKSKTRTKLDQDQIQNQNYYQTRTRTRIRLGLRLKLILDLDYNQNQTRTRTLSQLDQNRKEQNRRLFPAAVELWVVLQQQCTGQQGKKKKSNKKYIKLKILDKMKEI